MAELKQFAFTAGSQTLQPAIQNILDVINTTIGMFKIDDAESIGGKIGTGIYEGIGRVLSGPGLLLLTSILVKIGANLAKFLAQSSAQFLSMGKEAEALKITENQIQNLLIRRHYFTGSSTRTQSIRDLEKDITASLDKGNAELQLAVDLSKSMADNLQRKPDTKLKVRFLLVGLVVDSYRTLTLAQQNAKAQLQLDIVRET